MQLVPDTFSDVMDAAGRYLARRPRTEAEVRKHLLDRFDPAAVSLAIDRLIELRLIDDEAFAADWVEERSRRLKGPRLIEAELVAKGIDREIARAAVTPPDAEAQAAQAAARLLHRVARYPLSEQYGRLVQALLRRGFEREAADSGARAVLPPEGWD